jgi:hypothetical protein
MKAAQKVVGVYFNDGCVAAKDYIYFSGKLRGLDPDEYEFSRTFSYRAPNMGFIDHPGRNIVSVCHYTVDSCFYSLSTRGDVHLGARGVTPREEKIQDVESLGAVSQIRQIGEHLYVCGMQGQVYRRDESGWVHVDNGILDRKIATGALHLNSIDGASERDIYVAGFGGRILHFDGKRWTELVSPTNVHLERVRCVSESEVYFCGNKGTFIKLANGTFTDHSIDIEDHFWGLTSFEDKVYLATLKGLYVFDGTRVRPVDTKLKPPIDGYRLDARDGQLWSFGVDDLAWFDGKKWHRLKHPDNP